MQEYKYNSLVWYDSDKQPIIESRTLVLDTRIGRISDHDIPNPTKNPEAYFYAISIDGGIEQIQAFQPWVEWIEPMTEVEASQYLEETIQNILHNYNIYAE